MLELMEDGEYRKAAAAADLIDWKRVRNAGMLMNVSDIYEKTKEYQKSYDVMNLAYRRSEGSRKVIYKLCSLAIKTKNIDEAIDYYDEFIQIAPKDPNRHILRYQILRAQRAPIEQQIEALEEFKKAEYIEEWAYELAKLYREAGMMTECLEECDDLILWFSEGKYVYKAMELKMQYKPLSPSQQHTELQFGSAFQLLVATLLSAQCTDKRINMVTPALFARYPDARHMAQASEEDIYELISSVSYPNAKAKHLAEMSRQLVDMFGGEVPEAADDLEKLAGVGRKTANVIRAVWFGHATMAVDTHVYRVSHRMGLVPKTADTPRKVEDYLMKHIPAEDIPNAHHWILLHGRYICKSTKPLCDKCFFNEYCPKLLKDSKL